MDRHVWNSTVHAPKTVRLIDSTTSEAVWEKRIPTQHRLVIDLDRRGAAEGWMVGLRPATKVKWWMYRWNRHGAVDQGEARLPGNPIRIDLALRPGPENPPPDPRDRRAGAGASASPAQAPRFDAPPDAGTDAGYEAEVDHNASSDSPDPAALNDGSGSGSRPNDSPAPDDADPEQAPSTVD